ncbi:MAG: DsbA family protein [Chloroflexi bacterium]|nr:DsbA family protein [Chloroflexota bacterium]MCC6896966.1 thioredoxin domain-containing protein [Anaerolineae bacterium]
MGRTRTLERRKEREQEKKRQRRLTFIIGGVIVAVIAVIIVVLITVPAEAPIPAESLTRYEGIEQSVTDQGFPVLGRDIAPVKVTEYASFDCTHCRDFHEGTFSTVLERIRNNEVQFTFVPVFGTGSIQNGEGAAKAAVCAGQQGKFWQFHDALFSWQGTYANTAFSQNRFVGGINELGLDRGQWDSCVTGSYATQVVNDAVSAFRLQGASGTPALFVNGTAVDVASNVALYDAIDQALAAAGGVPVEVTPEATAPVVEATTEATTEPTVEATEEATAEATAAS